MKAKLGGLNNYLNTSSSREKRTDKNDRDETSSRRSRKGAPNTRRRYDELEDDQPVNNYARREVDIDNEEDHFYHSKQSAHNGKHHYDAPQLKRTSSRDVLPVTASSRQFSNGQPTKNQMSRSRVSEREQEREDERSRVRRQTSAEEYENFQHMRQETKQCMEVLSRRIGNCLSNMNEVIAEFRNNLRRMVEEEYNKLETLVTNIVESAFASELESVRKLCKTEEKKMSKTSGEIRDDLEQLYARLQKMKEGIDGPNWKRSAGDFFKEDVEGQAEQLINRSERLPMGKTIHMHFDQKR